VTTLLQRMHDELVRWNYAATTIRTYLHALRTCERHHRDVASISSARPRCGVTTLTSFERRSSPSGP